MSSEEKDAASAASPEKKPRVSRRRANRIAAEPREFYAFAEELAVGTLENRSRIDEIIAACAKNWTLARIARCDLAILRLAVYELLYRRDIPPVVSINEAVELAKIFSTEDSHRFVNGVLDRVKTRLSRPLREAQE